MGSRETSPPHKRQKSGGLSSFPETESTDISNVRVYESRGKLEDEPGQASGPDQDPDSNSDPQRSSTAPPPEMASSFETNDKVIGLHSKTQCWYSGVIFAYDALTKLYHVRYDDGDEDRLAIGQLRPFPDAKPSREGWRAKSAFHAQRPDRGLRLQHRSKKVTILMGRLRQMAHQG